MPKPEKLQNHSDEGKVRRKRKSEERERRRRKKAKVAFLFFMMPTLERVFGRKKLFDAKGPFG